MKTENTILKITGTEKELTFFIQCMEKVIRDKALSQTAKLKLNDLLDNLTIKKDS